MDLFRRGACALLVAPAAMNDGSGCFKAVLHLGLHLVSTAHFSPGPFVFLLWLTGTAGPKQGAYRPAGWLWVTFMSVGFVLFCFLFFASYSCTRHHCTFLCIALVVFSPPHGRLIRWGFFAFHSATADVCARQMAPNVCKCLQKKNVIVLKSCAHLLKNRADVACIFFLHPSLFNKYPSSLCVLIISLFLMTFLSRYRRRQTHNILFRVHSLFSVSWVCASRRLHMHEPAPSQRENLSADVLTRCSTTKIHICIGQNPVRLHLHSF